jgi:predicted nucleic acid-binding protein
VLREHAPPWVVCEAVLAEISASLGTPEPVLEMLQAGDLKLAFDLDENKAEVRALARKYRDQEMDLADACVVRMSELFDDALVYSVDRRDFSVYRRHGGQPIRCVFPD